MRALLALVVYAVSSAAGASIPAGDEDARRFYEQEGHRLVWVDDAGRPTQQAVAMLDALGRAGEDGLSPDRYRWRELARQAAALRDGLAPSGDLAAFDVGLTRSALLYLRHLHLGRVPARVAGFYLDHDGRDHDFAAELRRGLAEDSVTGMADRLRPPFVQYQGLQRALRVEAQGNPERASQIGLALERLRWLPDLDGRRLIVVNIPMFQLWGWNPERPDGMPILSMAAIIGSARRTQTPVFSADLTAVVINPEWNVPASIVRDEILPAMDRDPDYLRRHQMEMTTTGGTVRIRQRPGPWNALGRIKFLLPNPFDVYLHDTPTPALFSWARRDFSHGCVRVERPMELAEWVLETPAAWDKDALTAAIDTGMTRVVAVARPPLVVLFYQTAAFDPVTGTVRFADDIYGHDARLTALLEDEARTARPVP